MSADDADADGVEEDAKNWQWMRPEVQEFAHQMERQMRAHDKVFGVDEWKKASIWDLFFKLEPCTGELEQALNHLEQLLPQVGHPHLADAQRRASTRAANLANMAMMVSGLVSRYWR